MVPAPWFERAFSLDSPVSLFANTVERLRGTPARLEERTLTLHVSTLTERPSDTWSIQENVGHLADLEPLWLGRFDDLVEHRGALRPADLTNKQTHEAVHNAASIEELLKSFRDLRAQMIDKLERLDEAAISLSAPHPRLKTPMRTIDLAHFIAEHDDHHLARITELIRADEQGKKNETMIPKQLLDGNSDPPHRA